MLQLKMNILVTRQYIKETAAISNKNVHFTPKTSQHKTRKRNYPIVHTATVIKRGECTFNQKESNQPEVTRSDKEEGSR
jgi:hypothetical protein